MTKQQLHDKAKSLAGDFVAGAKEGIVWGAIFGTLAVVVAVVR